MSSETTSDQVASSEAKGQIGVSETEGTVEKMPADNQLAYETYKRALDQRAKFKEEAERYREEAERLKQITLESEGKKDEALSYWKDRANKHEAELKEHRASYAWNVVSGQLKAELASQGCVNPDKAVKLIDRAELKSIEVDDQYRVNVEDLKRIVDNVKRDNIDIGLFGKHSGAKYVDPQGVELTGNENKGVSELKDDDLMKLWKTL